MSSEPKSILVVAGDERLREHLAGMLRAEYRVHRAHTAEAAVQVLMREEIDLLLAENGLAGISGLELLRIVRENYPAVEVVMVSGGDGIDTAVQAIKDGAFHVVRSDVDRDALLLLLRHASERQDLNRQVLQLSDQVADTEREFVVGPSRAAREVVELVHKVARLSATILILGESGTGKELLARMVHRESDRASGPFITVNLGAIPRELVESTLFGHEKGSFTGAVRQQIGKFELADQGTLFLDEIGDLPLELQVKLLRAIQESEIERVGGAKPIRTDFRLVAATNVDLEKAVKEQRFREDLYYRINVIPIRMPPLRDRLEDVPSLVACFLDRYSRRFRKPIKGISESAMKLLASYWWPGNIRELENLIERLVAVSEKEWITEEDLPFEYHFAQIEPKRSDEDESRNLLQEACDTFERNFIVKSLEKSGWNVTATARYLGIPLSTLKHKINRLQIREFAKRLR